MTDIYTPDVTENGTKERAKRVKFGGKTHQTVPHEWAEFMLTWLFEHQKPAFGKALQHAAGLKDE